MPEAAGVDGGNGLGPVAVKARPAIRVAGAAPATALVDGGSGLGPVAVKVRPAIDVTGAAPATALVDGDNGLGPVAAAAPRRRPSNWRRPTLPGSGCYRSNG